MKMKINRRSFLKYALSGAAAMGTAHLTIAKDLFAAPAGPIVIGSQQELTGGFASWGYWLDKAGKAACDYINKTGGIAKRKVEYVVEDTESSPTVGARKFRRLVQRYDASLVIGSVHSGVGMSSVPVAKELKTIYFPQAMAEEMTGEKGNRYVFRANSDTYSQAAAGAEWASKNLGMKWTFIFADYAWGWSHYNEHAAVLKKVPGAQVLEKLAVPVGTKDLLPYLTKVPPETEELYSIFFGADSVAFFTQSQELGLDKKMKRYTVICTHEAICPKDLRGASEGIYMLEYLPRKLQFKDTPYHRHLRDAVGIEPVDGREVGGDKVVAGSHYWGVWESIFFLKKAIEQSGWKSRKDHPGLIKALEGMQVKESNEFPQGDKYIRPQDHKAVIDFYMSKVENGEINVKYKIPKEQVAPKMPPKVDFTKEAV
jgi:branched-chain amino acid transport system substrate-binding protein